MVRTRFLLVAVTLATVTASASSSATNVFVWTHGHPLRVLFVGDSLTVGVRSSAPDLDFTSLITARLAQNGAVTTKTLAKGGVGITYWKPSQLAASDDLVVIELGTNDDGAAGAAHPKPYSNFAPAYVKLLNAIRAKSPHAKIVCLNIWRPDSAAAMAAYAPAIRSVCTGGVFVNLARQALNPANVSPVDNFHPNDAGHAAIAGAILAKLGLK